MSDGKIYRCSWYFCSLCLTIAFINFKRRGNTKTFDKPRTGDEHHTQDTTRERGASEVSNDDGFELYDEVAADEREAIVPPMELSTDVLAMLATFDVDPIRGFLPSTDPLRRLPQVEYQPWEAMAAGLPKLLAAGQARRPLERLPVISIAALACYRERMRALLLLSTFAHACVWGNPDKPHDTIPQGVAIPLHALAAVEQMPPLMTHASLVLHNWHRLDPKGPLCARNLACNSRFLGGQDETWFYTITVEIEARGGGIFGALLEAQHAIRNHAETKVFGCDRSSAARVVLAALAVAHAGIREMREALSRMPVGCHPLIFYERVRPFLSGWKANPTLPNGVLYEGVCSRRMEYYGGSAAQSTLFPALDAALEVSHSKHSSNKFLLEMRDYMPPGHRRLLEHLTDPACPSIRRFIESLPENTHTSENGFKIVFPSNASQNGVQDSLKHGLAGVEGTCIPVGGEDEGLKGGTETCQGEGTSRERSRRHNEAIALREAYNGCLKALQDFRSWSFLRGIVEPGVYAQHYNERWPELAICRLCFLLKSEAMRFRGDLQLLHSLETVAGEWEISRRGTPCFAVTNLIHHASSIHFCQY